MREGIQNLTGRKFGRLEVKALSDHRAKNNKILWHCVCDCGNETDVLAASLKRMTSQSCGCLRKEMLSQSKTTHGKSASREMRSYSQMKQRCCNKENKDYAFWGGKGVTICDQWLDSFENFLKDMGERPANTTLDRKNNDGNYEPNNCRWATQTEQNRNRSNSKNITINNETKPLYVFADLFGVARTAVSQRINQYGWTIAMALLIPTKQRNQGLGKLAKHVKQLYLYKY
jgi:hypothetical protein